MAEQREMNPEEKAKLAAETAKVTFELEAAREKHERELKKLDVEVRKLDAEAAKTAAEADQAKSAATVTKIMADRESQKRERELADNENHFTYLFSGSVSEGSTSKCMSQLATWDRTHPDCEITIVINSPGGSVIDGMALFDYIQELRGKGHKITTKSLGVAASMGGILLQAGDIRVMGKEAWLLVHEAAFGASGKIGDVEDTVEWVKKVCDRILDIFVARCDGKIKKAQIKRNWTRKDWWISSDEALKLGFIDEIAAAIPDKAAA